MSPDSTTIRSRLPAPSRNFFAVSTISGGRLGVAQLRSELDERELQRLSLVDAAFVRDHARWIEHLARERRRKFLHQRIGAVRIVRFVDVQLRVRRVGAMRVRRIRPGAPFSRQPLDDGPGNGSPGRRVMPFTEIVKCALNVHSTDVAGATG